MPDGCAEINTGLCGFKYSGILEICHSTIGVIMVSMARHNFGWWITNWIAGLLFLEMTTNRPSQIRIWIFRNGADEAVFS